MKYLFLFFISTLFCNAQNIEWKTFGEAQEEQKNSSKDILLLVGISKTHFSIKKYVETIEGDTEFMKFLNENYILTFIKYDTGEKINYKGEVYNNPNLNKRGNCSKKVCAHDFVSKVLAMEVSPSFYIFKKNGNMSEPIVGALKNDDLLKVLNSYK